MSNREKVSVETPSHPAASSRDKYLRGGMSPLSLRRGGMPGAMRPAGVSRQVKRCGPGLLLTPADPALKIPHMGWNELRLARPDHPVLAGIADGDHAYFVHSYALTRADPAQVLAEADHGGRFPAIVGRDNLVGTQFHPEKSQETGLRLITNFLGWAP